MEVSTLEKFLTSLKYVSQSPLALLGVVVIVGLWAFYIFKKKHVEEAKERLSIIEKLPAKDRAKAFDNEYKTVPRKGLSSQQWLTWQKHKLFLIAFFGTLFFIAIIVISALWFSSTAQFERINKSSETENPNDQKNINYTPNTNSNLSVSQRKQITNQASNSLPINSQGKVQNVNVSVLENKSPNNIQNVNSQNTNSGNQILPENMINANSNKIKSSNEEYEKVRKKFLELFPEGITGRSKELSPNAKQEIEDIKKQLDKLDDEALTMSFINFSDAYQKAKAWYDDCAITLGKADVWMRKNYQIKTNYRHDFEGANLYIQGDSDEEKIKWLKLTFESQLALLRVQRATINVDLIHYS